MYLTGCSHNSHSGSCKFQIGALFLEARVLGHAPVTVRYYDSARAEPNPTLATFVLLCLDRPAHAGVWEAISDCLKTPQVIHPTQDHISDRVMNAEVWAKQLPHKTGAFKYLKSFSCLFGSCTYAFFMGSHKEADPTQRILLLQRHRRVHQRMDEKRKLEEKLEQAESQA